MIGPVVSTHLLLARGMMGIPALTSPSGGFAADQEDHILFCVVHDHMGDARAGLPADEVALAHRINISVEPAIDRAGHDIDEFFLVSFGMRIGRAAPGP